MKNCYRYILLATAAMMVAAACTKTHTEDGPNELMPISVSAVDGSSTKSLLDGEKFNTPGNRILIYDFVDNGAEPYFSDLIGPDVQGSPLAQATEGVWPFVNGPHQWTPGTHKFFGWLVNDANGTGGVTTDDLSPAGLFGDAFTFNPGTKTLSIPATTISQTSPQFDFMYSNVVSTEPQVDPVDLTFSHLFAAYYFSFTNDSAEPLELENVKLSIKSKASASLNYSGTAPVVNIDFTSDQPTLEKTYTTSIAAGKTIDLFLTGNEIASATEIPNSSYRLIWPQDLATATVDVVFSAWVTPIAYQYNAKGGPYNVDKAVDVGAGNGEYNLVNGHYEYVGKGNGRYNVTFIPDARGVYIEYVGDPEKRDVSKSIPLSSVTTDGKWIAGKKYNYNLSFSNDYMDLEVVVMKWDGGHGGNVTFN